MSASTPSIAPAAVLYTAGQPDLNNARNEVAFVLDNVADWKTLADGMRAGVEVVVLDSRGDGLAQMADWLAKKTPGSVDAIHLLSHGSSGAINLGALTLKSTNLNDHADTLAQIGSALTQDGDWLMYGCNVAAGAAGVDLIGQLVQASGADVAASTDLTGAATAGGDWVLEYAAGSIDAAAMPVSQYDQLLVDASFNFDSGVSGNTTATMTMTVSGETLNIVITQDNLYLTSYAGESPINGSDSVLTGNNNATKITFSLAGGKQFGLSSLKIREVFGASESLTLRTNNGSTAAYSLTPDEAYTWDVSGNPNMQGITSVELTGTSAFLLVIDDVSLSSIQNTAPSVTTPTAITLTDTSTADTFTNQTGTLSATDSDGIASYGISSPTSTNANFSDGGITYDIRKIGTYGSLYVKSSDGKYVYVPEANPTNALSTNASETFTVTATDSNASPATGTATLTVNITGVNDSPVADETTYIFQQPNPGAEGVTLSQTVASWLTSFTGQSDAETSGASLGVGFNAVNSSGGTFSYSTDNNTWYTLNPANFSSNPYVLLSPTTYLRLQTNADNAGTVVFNMKLWDGTGTASTNTTPSATTSANTALSLGTLEISGSTTSQNDAPTLSGGPYALTTTNEDTTSSGTLVSTILTGVTYADVDTGSIKGMAVTATTGNGTWQYSTDGTTWNGMGSVSASGALLLSNSTQVRYIPDNANGETPTFTFRGWDTTNGTTTNNTTAASTNSTRATADTTTTGGSTAFSTGTAQASLSVTAVNDTPTDIALSNAAVSVFDGTNATVGTLSSTDVDTGDTFTYSLVSGTGSTDNALFNFSGNTLRANDASALTAGTYSIRVRTTDSGSLTFEKAITLTVTDALTVTTIQDSGSDATTGGSYAAELADGAGLSLREALALASAGNKTIGFAAGLSGQTITLGSNATVPGGTTFDADAAGTLTVSTNSLVLSGALNVSNGSGDTLTIDSTLSGSGNLTKSGAGKLKLGSTSNSTSHTGTTTVSEGMLEIASGNRLGSGTVTLNGGTLGLANVNGTVVNAISLGASGGTVLVANSTAELSGIISGAGSLNKTGGQNLTLSGTNTYSGGTTLTGGKVTVSGSSNLGTGTVTFNGGTLSVNGGTFTNAVEIGGNGGTLETGSSGGTISGALSGSGALVKTGTGALLFSGAVTSSSTFDVQAGSLYVVGITNSAQAFGTGTVTLASGTTFGLAGSNLTATNNFVLAGDASVISGNAAGTRTLSGTISETGGARNLTLNASSSADNRFVISGNNTYSGTTTIVDNSGVVIGGSNTAFGSGAIGLSGKIGVANGISLANNITLSGSAAQVFADTGNSGTFAGVISGAQPLSKAGAGTVTLSGASTYSGSTSVTAGTLAVTGSIVNTSTLTVASGGTLTGSGTVGTVATAGTVTVQSGGTLAPGVNGPGTLTLNQGLTVASGGTLAMQLNGATAGTGFDQLVVKGAVSLTGASLTTSLGYSPGGGDSFTLIDNDGTDAVVGTFSGLAEGATINLGGTNYIISYVGGTGNDVVVSFPPNAVPTLVSFAAAVATASEDTQKEITLTNLAAQGNEADSDGTVTGFVVQAVSTGTLKIGTSAVAATAWDANTNNTVDATHHAYWTPADNASGSGLNAFTVKAKDNGGAVSVTAVQVTVDVTEVNDTPALSANGSAPTFTEDGSAVTLFGTANATTQETGQTLSGLTLTVTNVSDTTERLGIDGSTINLTTGGSGTTATNGFAYSVSVTGGTATVTLSKTAGISVADMQTLVTGMTYSNTSQAPSTASTRVVTLTAIQDNGGTANGGADTGTPGGTGPATVTVLAVNDAPSDISLSANTITPSGGTNATVGTLSTIDVDTGDTHSYSLVAGNGTNDAHNASFNISSGTLRANDASTLAIGTYNVLVRTTDNGAGNLTYDKSFTITVADVVAPIVTSIDHQTPTSSPTNADSLTFRVTFSKAVSGVDTADFTVSGTTATVASVTQVGSTNAYDVLLSGGDLASVNGSVTMAFAGGQNIADTATTPNALTVTTPTGTNNHTYVLDNAAPTLTINTVAGDDRVNGTEDDSAVTVSGTTTVEDGQVVAVSVGALNKTAPVTTGAWSVSLSSTEVQGLTTGNVAITADVSDATGNAATQATKTVVYDPSATLIVNTELDSGDDATLGASLSADMADGGGLSLREALHWSPDNGQISFAANLNAKTITLGSDASVKAGTTWDLDTVGELGISGSTLNLAGFLNIANGTGDSLTIGSSMVGSSGAVTKTGAGALTLSGSNSYAGTTVINSGKLSISSDANLGADYLQIGETGASVNASNRASLHITGSGSQDFNNALMVGSSEAEVHIDSGLVVTLNGKLDENPDGSGRDLIKTGGGTLILASTENEAGLSGDIFVEDGDVQVADDNSIPAGEIYLAEGKEMEFTGDSATELNNPVNLNGDANFNVTSADKIVTISGEIKGGAGNDFTQKGNGTLKLTGNSTFSGATHLSSGTMLLNGSLANTSSVTVSGKLGGSGSIGTPGSNGSVTVENGGTLAAGNSPGILTLNNGLSLKAGAKLEAEINTNVAGTGYDQIVVKGAVNLSDATLVLKPTANLASGEAFTLINNDGTDAVVGTFAGLANNATITASGKSFSVNYAGGDGNDVVLTSFTPADPTPDQTPTPTLAPAPAPTPAEDGDGVSNAVESTVPALSGTGGSVVAGDGNGDGVSDASQKSVSSTQFRVTDTISTDQTAPQTFVTLVADSNAGKANNSTSTITEIKQLDAPIDTPPDMKLPLGLIAFKADIAEAGSQEKFSLYVDPNLEANGYWKKDSGGTWVNLASAAYGGQMVEEGGKLRLDFQILDGGQFDSDGAANGTISDPGIVGSLVQSITDYHPKLPVDHFWF